jgi:hypothetical protein|tara:strand:- start:4244 stop:4876 length:633 start_codon:yes stop_codon:yes gene_type:complete
MSKYFNYFPKTAYSLDNTNNVDVVTSIITRFAFESSFRNNTAVYYEYNIQDSDTPEIIANKFYGDSEKHWVVLMLNDIVDPQFDWPLDQRTIISYMNEKYSANASVGQSGVNWAQANIHSYYKVETRTTNSTGTELQSKLEIDANTYANVAATTTNLTLDDGNSITITVSKETKSYYDYEIEENETKRTIKLLKPEFIRPIENELISALS